MNHFIKLSLSALALSVVLSSCAKKNRVAEGLMDDPQTHYLQGKKYWDQGDYPRAREQFNLSKSLDKKFCAAYAGLAITDAAEGKFDQAHDNSEEAIDLCDENPVGYIAEGIVYTIELKNSKDDEWFEKPEGYLEEAIEKDPKSGEAYYRLGNLYKLAFKFRKAEDSYQKVLELKKDYEKEANAQWEFVQKVLRAAPGTRVGQRIALIDEISRADVAALFVAELELDRILAKRLDKNYDNTYEAPKDPRKMQVDTLKKMASIIDIDSHWAKNYILDLNKLGVRGLTAGPDHKFHPEEKIHRSHYAMFIEAILASVNNDPKLATKNLGDSQARFKDVALGAPYYNAIANMSDMGIMKGNLRGEFSPQQTVSGADALLIIKRIKELRK
jgi:tetratricopeptide (TPR) repeat protein